MIQTLTYISIIVLIALIILIKIFYDYYIKDKSKPVKTPYLILSDKNPYKLIYFNTFGEVTDEIKFYQY